MNRLIAALAGTGLALFVAAAAWAQSVFVVLSGDQAERMGIDLRQSRRVTTHTANGPVPAYVITLASVQVGEIGLLDVPAMVIEGGAEKLPAVLIGMSFLKHFEMRRAGQTMTLTRSNPR